MNTTPNSKFHNSILESERENFPNEIEVNTDSSINPHGRYELAVIANGDLLGTYYYDTTEQMNEDMYALEDYHDVKF